MTYNVVDLYYGSLEDNLARTTLDGLVLDIGGGAGSLLVKGAAKAPRWLMYGTADAAKVFDGGVIGANTGNAANRATFEVYKDSLIS